jgi:roadblock/LC7 domain-containing protein
MRLIATLLALTASFVAAVPVFGPYKDVSIAMDWTTNAISTAVTGKRSTLLSELPETGANVVTWAFAAGSCGEETWAGLAADALASANVQKWADAGAKYIVATGGALGTFTCASDSDFTRFIERYQSDSLVGFDFDIENGTQEDIGDLVQRVKTAQEQFPDLRFSFTLATLGGGANPSLNAIGRMVMQAIEDAGLTGFFINLMAMDYGSPLAGNCVLQNGQCQMGASAIKAATSFHTQYGVPLDHIEVTPMIGANDSPGETFTLDDATALARFAAKNGLAGLHFWSLDRDAACPAGQNAVSPTCNSIGADALAFSHAFAQGLGGSSPKPSPQPSPRPSREPAPQPCVQPTHSNEDVCSSVGCANACLWTYTAGTQCLDSYPRVSCEAYGRYGYTWCE